MCAINLEGRDSGQLCSSACMNRKQRAFACDLWAIYESSYLYTQENSDVIILTISSKPNLFSPTRGLPIILQLTNTLTQTK